MSEGVAACLVPNFPRSALDPTNYKLLYICTVAQSRPLTRPLELFFLIVPTNVRKLVTMTMTLQKS